VSAGRYTHLKRTSVRACCAIIVARRHHIRSPQCFPVSCSLRSPGRRARQKLGASGVDGAIHRAAGPELLAECRAIGGCNTGDAIITKGHRLPAKYVIHTVGPIWQGGSAGEADLLANCYISSLKLAAKHGVRTLAFPSISTGAYRYPLEQASQIAMRTLTSSPD